MATYKVPQDVEADDKLIGPFSFRQFIYLMIVAAMGFLAWGLSQIFIGLIVIPLPVILFFGALALPLRKDQPMEIYLAALVSFYLKPRQRLWDPEGVESLIEISAPKVVEVTRTKDLSQSEAQQRLSYLANIVDSGGWAIRGGFGGPAADTSMNSDVYLEAQGATDVLDTTTSIAQNIDQMMAESTERMRQEARERMLQATQAAAAAAVAAPPPEAPVAFDPYPAIKQSVIQPLSDAGQTQAQSPTLSVALVAPTPPLAAPSGLPSPVPQPVPGNLYTDTVPPVDASSPEITPETSATTSGTQVSAGIMNLANNPDLSIETIASEAQRIQRRSSGDSDEVIISLR